MNTMSRKDYDNMLLNIQESGKLISAKIYDQTSRYELYIRENKTSNTPLGHILISTIGTQRGPTCIENGIRKWRVCKITLKSIIGNYYYVKKKTISVRKNIKDTTDILISTLIDISQSIQDEVLERENISKQQRRLEQELMEQLSKLGKVINIYRQDGILKAQMYIEERSKLNRFILTFNGEGLVDSATFPSMQPEKIISLIKNNIQEG